MQRNILDLAAKVSKRNIGLTTRLNDLKPYSVVLYTKRINIPLSLFLVKHKGKVILKGD